MTTLDPRIVSVTIQLESETRTYTDLAVRAIGKKFRAALHNVCEIRVANIDKQTRDYLLTVGTPFNRLTDIPRNRILVEAGRQSYGQATVYDGGITTVIESQPPDIWMVINALTTRFEQGVAISTQATKNSSFRAVAQQLANSLSLQLEYLAPEFTLTNYNYSGSLGNQVKTLDNIFPNVDVYIDDSTLVVQGLEQVRRPGTTFFITSATGLIGKPNFDAYGVRCTVLYSPDIVVGAQIELDVSEYPAANGIYTIYELGFDLANREQPFYYHINARRPLI